MSTKCRKLFFGTAFLKTPLKNGLGRYVPQLQRITLKFCKTSGASLGIREYIETNLLEFAQENPGVVVYLKPRRHRSPCLKAEYLNGQEEYIGVHNQKRIDVVKWIDYLKNKSGEPTKLLLKNVHTDFPSIQGVWTPFVHKDPSVNMAQFPNEDVASFREPEPTGSEELLELYKQQTQDQS